MTALADIGIIGTVLNWKGGGKMKRRTLAILLAAWMLLTLGGCGRKTDPVPEPEPAEKTDPLPPPEPEPEPEPVLDTEIPSWLLT